MTAPVPPHAAVLMYSTAPQLWLCELCPTPEKIAQKLLVMGRTEQVVLDVLLRECMKE